MDISHHFGPLIVVVQVPTVTVVRGVGIVTPPEATRKVIIGGPPVVKGGPEVADVATVIHPAWHRTAPIV